MTIRLAVLLQPHARQPPWGGPLNSIVLGLSYNAIVVNKLNLSCNRVLLIAADAAGLPAGRYLKQ